VVSELQTITKLALSTRTSLNAANQEYDKITDANAATPSAPVHAARLNGLLKTLANAEGAVTESMKARKLLIRDLEAFLKTHVDELAKEEAQIQQLSERRIAIDAKKKDVEDTIMRGFANNSNPGSPTLDNSPGQGHSQSPMTPAPEPDRPEVEALTPPTQSPRSPQTKHEHIAKIEDIKVPEPLFSGHAPSHAPAPPPPTPATAGLDLLASLSAGSYSQQTNGDGGAMKKRKISSTVADDFPDLGGDAMDGLDDDVKDMLRGN
jgi:regulator of Ty1 transposition protein 103